MKNYNKGEWGELYTAIKIINDKKIAVADIRLNSRNEFIDVLRLFLKSIYGEAIYDITTPKIALFIDGQLKKNVELDKSDIQELLNGIQNGEGRSFAIPVAEKIIKSLELDSIKANATIKADIVMEADIPYMNEADVVFRTGAKKEGFTIKSMIGAKPTLLNTSRSTNFKFKIDNFSGNIDEINNINGSAKIMKRIEAVRSAGGKLSFFDMADDTFEKNLRLIDFELPRIVAVLLFAYYTTHGSSDLSSLVKQAVLLLPFKTSEEELKHKIKEFVCAIALGMMPTTLWDGTTINGGCIIAKNDGDLVCFTLLDKDEFKDYLFKHIKFDSPSSTRHDYGSLYEENGELFMNLNIQLRFL